MTVLIAKSSKEIRFYSRNSLVYILHRPRQVEGIYGSLLLDLYTMHSISDLLNYYSEKPLSHLETIFFPYRRNDDQLCRSGL